MGIDEMRAHAASRAPMVRKVQLGELEVHATSDEDEGSIYLEWHGHHLALEPKALRDFSRLLGVTSSAVRRITKDHGNRGVRLIDALRTARASGSKRRGSVYLTVDRNQNVHRVTGDGSNNFDHDGFFDILESYLNTDKFAIDDYSAGLDGRIEVVLRAPGGYELDGYQNERFLPGVSLKLRPSGITAVQHALRLLCDNGLDVPDVTNPVYGHTVNVLRRADDMVPWLNGMAAVKAAGYRDPAFDQRVVRAINTKASLAELLRAENTIRQAITSTDKDADVTPDAIARFVDTRPTQEGFRKAGIVWETVSDVEAPHLRTDRTVWDLINGITDLASHDYASFPMESGDRGLLREAAGKILMNTFDLEHAGAKQAF